MLIGHQNNLIYFRQNYPSPRLGFCLAANLRILIEVNEQDLKTYLEFAQKLADQAGKIMLQYFRADHEIELKEDDSPVTIADKAVNSMVIMAVKEKFEGHGVLGEEESFNTDSDLLWVCDPIDGTVGYTYHLPIAMFSLALVKNGTPIVACAFNPFTNDKYWAVQGQGAFRNGHKITVSRRHWGTAAVARTASNRAEDPLNSPKILRKVMAEGNRPVQTYGCVFKSCLIAEGSIEGYIFTGPNAHDVAATALIVTEAGGRVTDIEGNQQGYNTRINGAILSNGQIHQQLLDLVKEHANTRD